MGTGNLSPQNPTKCYSAELWFSLLRSDHGPETRVFIHVALARVNASIGLIQWHIRLLSLYYRPMARVYTRKRHENKITRFWATYGYDRPSAVITSCHAILHSPNKNVLIRTTNQIFPWLFIPWHESVTRSALTFKNLSLGIGMFSNF